MGKLRNTWKKIPRDILKMNGGTMLDAVDFEDGKFIVSVASFHHHVAQNRVRLNTFHPFRATLCKSLR
jgi:hypothetical protein